MKKTALLFFCSIMLCSSIFAQNDLINQLNENNIIGFSKPLATTLGMGINSGSFHSAYVPKTFGFSLSFRGMLITVPDDQLTYTPTLPNGYKTDSPSPTIWGKKGGASYLGPNGYYSLPGGIDEKNIPFVMPQLTFSALGTELLVRFIPSFKVGEENISFIGFGLKHSVSQYIPFCPVDIAVQAMYNKLEFSDIIKGTNLAFNAQASRAFGFFTAYGALQYESSKFDLNYTFKGDAGSPISELAQDRKISAQIEGDNNFRFILGGAIKLSVLVLNADVNLGSQTVFSGGLSFEF